MLARWRPLLWSLLAWCCCAGPILGHALMPGTDLPQHLAIASVLWRLLSGSGDGLPYAVALQPTPYYLAYVPLTPLVGLAGPERGAQLFLLLLAAAQVAANAACLRALRAPAWANVVAAVAFFGPLFYYGFVATMAGLPCIMWMVAGLLRWQTGGRARPLRGAALAAAAATLAHALLALPCAVIAVSFAAIGRAAPTTDREAPSPAWAPLGVAVAAALPLTVAIWQRLAGTTAPLHTVTWPGAAVQWHYFKGFLGPFDHGVGRAAHLVLLVLGLIGAWQQRRRPAARALLLAAATLTVAFMACPRALVSGTSPAWGLGFRMLCVAELLLLPLVPHLAGAAARRVGLALGLCVAVHGVAQWRAWDRFGAAAAPLHAALAALPPSARVVVAARGGVSLARVWPPVLSHLAAYHVARGGRCTTSVFAGGHLPIRGTAACDAGADYLLQQANDGRGTAPPAPAGARPLFAAGPWRLSALAAGPS